MQRPLQCTLQRTATHCNALQCTATHCNTLQRTTTHYNALQRTATHCNALQRTATHCNALQRTATTTLNAIRLVVRDSLWSHICTYVYTWCTSFWYSDRTYSPKKLVYRLTRCHMYMCMTKDSLFVTRCSWLSLVIHMYIERILQKNWYIVWLDVGDPLFSAFVAVCCSVLQCVAVWCSF